MNLTKELLIVAMNKSFINAGQLIEDALILKENQRYARAYTLFQLATEEIGKSLLTINFLLFKDYTNKKSQQEFLKEFRDHKIKASISTGIDFLMTMIKGSNKAKKSYILSQQDAKVKVEQLNN